MSASANELRRPSSKRGGETKEQTQARHKKRKLVQANENHFNKGVALKQSDYLRARMRKIYPEVLRLQKEDNAAYDEGKLQPRRTALNPDNVEGGEQLVAPENRGYLGLMRPPETAGEHKFISYDQLCDAQAQDNFDALISGNTGNDGGAANALLIKSNRETASFVHAYKHMDAILAPVPFRVGDVWLTPEQRLGIGLAGSAYSEDVFVESKKYQPNPGDIPVSLGLPAGTAPELFFDNCPTGTGKTFSNLIRNLLRVVSDEAYENTKREWEAEADRGQPLNNTRIVEYGATHHRELARVVLFFVPAPLMNQWAKAANDMKQVFLDSVGQTFTVWEGLDVIRRKGRGPNGEAGIYKTLGQAHSDAQQYGQAILWLMKAETASSKASMRSHPHLTPVARIYDEAGGEGRATEPKGKDPESDVKHNQCINATMGRLQKSTRNQPNHPITRALGDEMRMSDPRHMAILYISTVPDWLRDMVARGMRARMPRGISLMSFKVKVQSIAAALGHSDMAIQSVDDLITNQLRRTGGLDSLSEQEKKNLHTRCKNIMTRSGQYSGNTIADVLQGAMNETNEQLRKVPADPKPAVAGGHLNHAQQEIRNQLNQQRRAFKAMLRLYESLHTAVCPKEAYECPILMIDITPAETVVMPCCCHVVSQQALESVRNKSCPFCRAPLSANLLNHAQLQDMLAPLAQQHVEAPPAGDEAGPSAAAEPSVLDQPVPEGDDERFRAVVKALSAEQWKAGPEASIALIERALEWRGGRGLRILLAFNCGYNGGGAHTSTKKLREMLMKAIPSLTSVDFVNGEQTSGAVLNYQKIDDTNRVMCVDTSTSSVSLAGLNFPNTHLIIFDRVNNRYGLKPATMIQAIGRAIRPQVPRADMALPYVLKEDYYAWLVDQRTRERTDFEPIELEPPESAFPEKLVVFLDSA